MKTKPNVVTRLPARHTLDPKSINSRLYGQVSTLLSQLEDPEGHITLKERIAALIAIGRLQVIFMGLRKEKTDDHAGTAGSAVRKYAGAFADDNRRRKARPRPAPEPTEDDIERIIGAGTDAALAGEFTDDDYGA